MLGAKSFFETPPEQLTPRMEEEFFTSLMTKNKTYKTTFHNRFSNINTFILQYLKKYELLKPRILDIGVSSGISTVELYDDLCKGGVTVDILATDILTNAYLIRVFPGCHALVDAKGFPLRLDFPCVSMKPWVTRGDYYNGLFILRKVLNMLFTRRAGRILHHADDARIRKVKLVTPRAQEKTGITVHTDDIGRYNESLKSGFDFVRAANVINHGYFPPDLLRRMVGNIGRYLRPPCSSLLVVRTHEDRSNHGTLFRLRPDHRFEVVHRFGSGSEIEDIVLSAEIASA